MKKARGPECPTCGCAESRLLRLVVEFGVKAERRCCSCCSKVYTHAPGDNVEPPRIIDEPPPRRCPACHTDRVKVVTTRRPMRSCRCLACGWTFQTVEQKC